MIEWRSEGFAVESVPQITVNELAEWLEQGREVTVIDVREHAEWLEGHIKGATHLPMLEAASRHAEVPTEGPKAVLCAGGLRSSTAISAQSTAFGPDRKSTRLNSSHEWISYAVFCLKKKNKKNTPHVQP